jgi:hypothetical protein
MNPALVHCPKCRWELSEGIFNRQDLLPCPSCNTPLEVEIFPAFFRRIGHGQTAEALIVDGESSCFFHPEKKAIIPCAGCGRFLCALCDCELHGEHFCPPCLEAGRTKGKIKSIENQRTLHDNIALALAFYPILMWVLTILTAPAALYLSIRHWNSPRSIVHRTKIRFVLAIIMAGLQITGWVILFVFILNRKHA